MKKLVSCLMGLLVISHCSTSGTYTQNAINQVLAPHIVNQQLKAAISAVAEPITNNVSNIATQAANTAATTTAAALVQPAVVSETAKNILQTATDAAVENAPVLLTPITKTGIRYHIDSASTALKDFIIDKAKATKDTTQNALKSAASSTGNFLWDNKIALGVAAGLYAANSYGLFNPIKDYFMPAQGSDYFLKNNMGKIKKYTFELKSFKHNYAFTFTSNLQNPFSNTTLSQNLLKSNVQKGIQPEKTALRELLEKYFNNEDDATITITGSLTLSNEQTRNLEPKTILLEKDGNSWNTAIDAAYVNFIQPMFQSSLYVSLNDIEVMPDQLPPSIYKINLMPSTRTAKTVNLLPNVLGQFIPTTISGISTLQAELLEEHIHNNNNQEQTLRTKFQEWAKPYINTPDILWTITPEIMFEVTEDNLAKAGWKLNPLHSQFFLNGNNVNYTFKNETFRFGKREVNKIKNAVANSYQDLITMFTNQRNYKKIHISISENLKSITQAMNIFYLYARLLHNLSEELLNITMNNESTYFNFAADILENLYTDEVQLQTFDDKFAEIKNQLEDLLNNINDDDAIKTTMALIKLSTNIQSNNYLGSIIRSYRNINDSFQILDPRSQQIIGDALQTIRDTTTKIHNKNQNNQEFVRIDDIKDAVIAIQQELNNDAFKPAKIIIVKLGLKYHEALHKDYEFSLRFKNTLETIKKQPSDNDINNAAIDILFETYIRPIFTRR